MSTSTPIIHNPPYLAPPLNGAIKIKDAVFAGCFLLLIFLPALGMIAGIKPFIKIEENRKMASMPDFKQGDIRKSIARFGKFFDDNFGFRNELILFNRALRYFVLGTSGDDRVLIAKDGWLVFKLRGNLTETRNLELFTPDELKKWGQAIQARSDYAKSQGATYLFAMAPDPKTTFPEILPDWIPPPNSPSRLDQLYGYLAEHTDVQFLDLRPVLRAHRTEPIYYHTDTHWNSLGAYYGYRGIMERLAELRPDLAEYLKPIELDKFDLTLMPYSGDLTRMMGLPGLIIEQTVGLVPHQVWQANTPPGRIDEYNFTTTNPQRPKAPRLLIFRDSYTTALQAQLADHFSFTRFRWSYGFQRRMVKKDKPDIIIQFFVERVLAGIEPRSFQGG